MTGTDLPSIRAYTTAASRSVCDSQNTGRRMSVRLVTRQTNRVIQELGSLRVDLGISKAELALW